ncbi:MAG TPA: hypothetical protein VE291_08015 [Terracidiphilus sp.]|jgi:hypothetical protein|nr:hypothetical protein [Terracidiphilus sp.]
MFRIVWTLISLGSALSILLLTIGSAAWNGVNFVVGLYLLLSFTADIGLFFGFWAAYSNNPIPARVVLLSAVVIASLAAIYACGFLFGRSPGVPLNDPLYVAGLAIPVVALYAVTFLCSSVEAGLFFNQARWRARRQM